MPLEYLRRVGFNPCFIGLASATKFAQKIAGGSFVFQSLFYWISLCDEAVVNYIVVRLCVSILVLLD